VWELVKSGGLLMLPIIVCSIISLAIILEKFLSLNEKKIAPPTLLNDIWQNIRSNQMSMQYIKEVRDSSPLGMVLAAGLTNSRHGREIMKERIEETAGFVIHNLGQYLNTLGTIASIAPLLGLLGTVVGMIEIFSSFTASGNSAQVLAGGIAKALITTAAGLIVGIIALFFYRFLTKKVDNLVVQMEQDAIKLVEITQYEKD
jgi:biopolymer transport protein ExbB